MKLIRLAQGLQQYRRRFKGASLLSLRSSTTRIRSSTGNAKQFEHIYFVYNEICLCNSNAYNKGG